MSALTPEQQMLALAAQLERSPSDEMSASSDEREVAALLDAAMARQRTYAAATAWLETRLAKEAADRHERETDPLTTLRATIEPASPDDIVVVGTGPRTAFFEFRRADGRRYIYSAAETLSCIPRADWELQSWGADWVQTQRQNIALRAVMICKADRFDDLPGMLADAYTAQAFPPDYRATRLEGIATSLCETDDHHRARQLARWWKFSSVAQEGEHWGLADAINTRLGRLGLRHLVVDEVAEINARPSGLGPTHTIYR